MLFRLSEQGQHTSVLLVKMHFIAASCVSFWWEWYSCSLAESVKFQICPIVCLYYTPGGSGRARSWGCLCMGALCLPDLEVGGRHTGRRGLERPCGKPGGQKLKPETFSSSKLRFSFSFFYYLLWFDAPCFQGSHLRLSDGTYRKQFRATHIWPTGTHPFGSIKTYVVYLYYIELKGKRRESYVSKELYIVFLKVF